MTRFALALVAGLAAAGPAGAVDWSLGGRVSEELQANTNPGLDPDPDGIRFGSRSRVTLDLGARTPRTDWLLSTGATLTFFTGDGDDDDLNGLRPNVTGRMRYEGRRYTLTNRLRFERRSTAFSEFVDALPEEEAPQEPTDFADDGIVVERDTERNDLRVSSTLDYRIAPLDTVSLGLSASIRRYADDAPGLSTADNFGATLAWSHRLDPVSAAGLTLSVLRFTSDATTSPANTDGLSLSAAADYRTRATRALELSGSLGVSYTDRTEQTVLLDRFLLTEDDQSFGVTGSLAGTLTRRDSRLSFSLSQAVRPGSFGDVRNVTSASASYVQRLTPRAELRLSGAYSLQSDVSFGDEIDQFYSVGPSLDYRLARDWRATLAYRFRGADEENEGNALGNSVQLRLTHDFDLLR